MRLRGTTLIELLIVTAMLAIFSAGLFFSTTQITQRAIHSERVMLLEMEMARAIDTLMGDAMQATGHAVSTESIAFDGPEGTMDYRLEGGRLIRRWRAAGMPREGVIADNLSEVEFTPEERGLTVTLRGELSLRTQITERHLTTFIAWPEEVGR